MKRAGPHIGEGGWSLLELVLVVILIAFLFLFAIDRLLPLRGQAEAASVLQVEGALRSGLGAEIAARVLREGLGTLPELADSNPMKLLSEAPASYVGERQQVDPHTMEPGEWAFDRSRGILVYRVRFPRYFHGSLGNPPRAEWRVALHPPEASHSADVRGVLLTRLGDWRWTLEEEGQ